MRPTGLRAHDYAIPGTTQLLAPTSPAHHQFRYKTRPARPKWLYLARFPLAGRVLSRFCRQQAEQGEFSPAPAPPHHGHERNNTPTQHSKPRGETFTAPAPHTNPRGETFSAPAPHTNPRGETFTAPAPHTNPRGETFTAPAPHTNPRGETFTAPAPHTNPRGETFSAPARHKQPKITHFHHAGANFLSTTGVKTKPTNSRMQFHTAPPQHNLIIRRIPTSRLQTMKHIRGNCMRNYWGGAARPRRPEKSHVIRLNERSTKSENVAIPTI